MYQEDLKNNTIPQKNMCIEFEATNGRATNIRICSTCFVEKSNTKLAIATVFVTLILKSAAKT